MRKNLVIAALLSYVIADMPIWVSRPDYLGAYLFLAMAAGLLVWRAYREELEHEKRKKDEPISNYRNHNRIYFILFVSGSHDGKGSRAGERLCTGCHRNGSNRLLLRDAKM